MWVGSPAFPTTTTTVGSKLQTPFSCITTTSVSSDSSSSSYPTSKSAGMALTGEESLLSVEGSGIGSDEVEEEMVVDGGGCDIQAARESECEEGDVKIKVEDNE